MEKISIKKLRYLYESYKSKYSQYKVQSFLKFNYLNLSVHFSRDEREFDEPNFRLLLDLTKKQRKERKNFIKNKQNIDGFSRYLLSFKENNYLPYRKLCVTLFFDLLKIFKQLLDIFGIIIIIFLSILNRFLKNKSNKKLFLKNQKIYSIYYWNKKKSASASYYYPDINFLNGDKAFISSFSDSKLLSLGLVNSLKNTDFISPSKILNIKELFISIIQFLYLFLHDFFIHFAKRIIIS